MVISIDKLLKDFSFESSEGIKPEKSLEELKNDCISKLKTVQGKYAFYLNKNLSINKLQKLSSELQETLELVSSAYEDKDFPNDLLNEFVKVSHYGLKYFERINNKKNEEVAAELRTIKQEYSQSVDLAIDDVNNRLSDIRKKMDGIWGNVLSVILSFSIVATLVEAIDKIDVSYIFIFALIIVWFGMTLIAFWSGLYRKDDISSSESRWLYGIVSGLLIIVILFTIFYSVNRGYLTDYVKPSSEISCSK